MTATYNKISSKLPLQIIFWLAIIILIIIAYLNIQPYERFASIIGEARLSNGVITLLLKIPVVNYIIANLGNLLSLGTGFILWAFIQTIECYPVFLRRDRKMQKVLIDEAEASDKIKVKDDDEKLLASMKKYYNMFPLKTVRDARRWSYCCYGFDLILGIAIYPPVSFIGLVVVSIDWANVATIPLLMFAFELGLEFVLAVNETLIFIKKAHGRSYV